ncbi:TPA: poly(R)-hydroxyalkanoic acid synthase subunit PhaE [Streptococcus suis]
MVDFNSMNQWFEAQKKLAEQWQSMFPLNQMSTSSSSSNLQDLWTAQQQFFNDYMKAFQPAAFTPAYPLPLSHPAFESWNKFQSSWTEQMEKAVKEGPLGNYMAQFPDMNTYLDFYRQQFKPSRLLDAMDSESYGVFLKMMDANQHFLSFYRYFDNLRDLYSKPLEADGKEMMEKWLADGQQFYTDFVQPFIPAQLRQLVDAPYQLSQTMKDNWVKFLGPWAESFFDLARLYVEGAHGDTDKLAEYFEVWKKQYEETVAPLLRVPGMGNNTEKIERHNAFIDNSIQLLLTSVEFQQKLAQVTRKRAKGLLEEYAELVKKGEQPQTYKEFYQHWSNEVEKTLQEYFYSDEFSQLLAKFGTANAQFVIARNKLLELSLKNLPVVLESDARSLYKKVQDLKREVNKLKRELKELKEPKEDAKVTKPKTSKKTDK